MHVYRFHPPKYSPSHWSSIVRLVLECSLRINSQKRIKRALQRVTYVVEVKQTLAQCHRLQHNLEWRQWSVFIEEKTLFFSFCSSFLSRKLINKTLSDISAIQTSSSLGSKTLFMFIFTKAGSKYGMMQWVQLFHCHMRHLQQYRKIFYVYSHKSGV